MSPACQFALAFVGILLLGFCVKDRALKTWLGISLVIAGLGLIFLLPTYIGSTDVGLFGALTMAVGFTSFSSRSAREK